MMKIYSQYIMNYSDSTQVTIDLQQDSDFLKWKQSTESELGKTLGSLLIMPVQRVPRYILLLTELYKHTWPDHPDYANLKQSAEEMEKLTKFLDHKRKESENLNKLASLTHLFKNKLNLNIVEPHRRFIREDNFNGKHTIHLFNDILIISEKEKRLNRPRFNFSHHNDSNVTKCVFYYLTQLELVLTSTGFQLRQNGVHTILFSCETSASEMKTWIDDFKNYQENSALSSCFDDDDDDDDRHGALDNDNENSLTCVDSLKHLRESYTILQNHINTLNDQMKNKKHRKDKKELEALQQVFVAKLQETDKAISEKLTARKMKSHQHILSTRSQSLDEDPLRITVNKFRRTSTDTNWFN